MPFVVLIPARLASSRLPRKALADIGGVPMIVRVAQRAARSSASRVVVAADDDEIVAACAGHGVAALLTSKAHAQRQRPDRRGERGARPRRRRDRRQRPGRRAADRAGADRRLRRLARRARRLRDEHRRTPDRRSRGLREPEHRQGGARRCGTGALLFARADSLAARGGRRGARDRAARRRCATSGSTRTAPVSWLASRACPPARSKRSSASSSCACSGTASGSPCT